MINVIKRDGSKVLLDLDKIHNVLEWACSGINGVSVSDIEIKSKLQFFDGIKTSTIHETLIKASVDLISEATPDYQYVAARLLMINIRKKAIGQFDPIPVYELVKRNAKLGWYTNELLDWYTPGDFEKMDSFIDHDRDMLFAYVGLKQMEGKYLVQNRQKKKLFETPQYLYMLVAATIFHNEPSDMRMDMIRDFYNSASLFDISLPTPVMAGVRTPQRQYSSCTVIEVDDTLDSIAATSSAIVKYVSQKAGIGLGAGRIRAEGSKIGSGHAVHTGVIPFFRLFESSVKSCSQGGVRNGSATLHFPCWHSEIMDVLVLKNNQGSVENRVRRIDYSIQFNGYMYKRLIDNQPITLFSPHQVPDLYEAFFTNQELFAELYEKYERNPRVTKTVVPSFELFTKYISERAQTGRLYLMNVDHCNDHSSFDATKAPIYMSNLCQEITLPTRPLTSLHSGATPRTILVKSENTEEFYEWSVNHTDYLPYNWGNKHG
jgi:ribonucleoside-diphosphate reductase alpha chain